MSKGWTCSKCGSTDVALRYPSGKQQKCIDCQRFYNLTVNSKADRKHTHRPELKITKGEFRRWSSERARECFYCGVSEADLRKLGLKTQIGRELVALGIDRINNMGDYEIDNIVFCCFVCNKTKGNVFTTTEMKAVGKAIARTWDDRLKSLR